MKRKHSRCKIVRVEAGKILPINLHICDRTPSSIFGFRVAGPSENETPTLMVEL